MTLFLYISRLFSRRFATFFGAMFLLTLLIHATNLFGQTEYQKIGALNVMRLALLETPNGVYRLLSIIAVLASLSMFHNLNKSGELVATRAAGISVYRVLAPPVISALLIGAIGVMAFNPLSAASLRKFETETGRYKSGSVSAFSLARKGLWLRQGSDNGQTVIFAERANFEVTHLKGVTFWDLTNKGIARRRIEASYAELHDGAWHLGPGKLWEINKPGQVPDRTAVRFDSMTIASELTANQILNSFGDPTTISIWETPSFIRKLERSGFSTTRHRVHFQSQLALPFLLAGMVMIGAAFSMRHRRAGGGKTMILGAVLAGLAVYIVQNFATILGAKGSISVFAAAWGTPVAAILLAAGLILHLEDG